MKRLLPFLLASALFLGGCKALNPCGVPGGGKNCWSSARSHTRVVQLIGTFKNKGPLCAAAGDQAERVCETHGLASILRQKGGKADCRCLVNDPSIRATSPLGTPVACDVYFRCVPR